MLIAFPTVNTMAESIRYGRSAKLMPISCTNHHVLCGNTFETKLKHLVVLQKRAIRLADKVNYREHSELLFAKYKWLNLCDIVNLKTLNITFQAKHMLLVTLQEMFKKSMYVHKYNTRSCTKGNFEVKFCKTKTSCVWNYGMI